MIGEWEELKFVEDKERFFINRRINFERFIKKFLKRFRGRGYREKEINVLRNKKKKKKM